MKRIGGSRRKTRHLLKKDKHKRGKISLVRYLQNFNMGDKVQLSMEPAVQSGMYHPRFYGRIGVVQSKQGKCYEVLITDGSKQKTLIVHPVHLRRM